MAHSKSNSNPSGKPIVVKQKPKKKRESRSRKTSKTPTENWDQGAGMWKGPSPHAEGGMDGDPQWDEGAGALTMGAAVVRKQLECAFLYYNILAANEQARRRTIVAARNAHPIVAPFAIRVRALEEEEDTAYQTLRAKKAGGGADTTIESARIVRIKAMLKQERIAYRRAVQEVKADPGLVDAEQAANVLAHAQLIEARWRSGLGVGTKNQVEVALEQAKRAEQRPEPGRRPTAWEKLPRVKKEFDGTGKVAIQLQPRGGDAEEVKDLLAESSGLTAGIREAPRESEERKGLQALKTDCTALIGDLRREHGKEMGLTVARAYACIDTRLQIEPCNTKVDPRLPLRDGQLAEGQQRLAWDPTRHRRHRRIAARTVVRMRTNDTTGALVWIEFPVKLARPLPPDGIIKWAWLLRRRVGTRFEHRFQLTFEAESFRAPIAAERVPTACSSLQRLVGDPERKELDPVVRQLMYATSGVLDGAPLAGTGTAAVNIGWRHLPPYNGVVRVLYWCNDLGEEGEVHVPSITRTRSTGEKVTFSLVDTMEKCDSIKAIRDKNHDLVKAFIVATLGTTLSAVESTAPTVETSTGIWPRWLIRGARELTHPRVKAREPLVKFQARLYRRYRTGQRFTGDERLLTGLVLWAHRERHLHAYEDNLRDRAINHRRDTYRLIARFFALRYARIVYCEMNLLDFAEAPAPEEGDPSDGKAQRRTGKTAAPGELRAMMKRMAVKTGAVTKDMTPKVKEDGAADDGAVVEQPEGGGPTQTCHLCGFYPETPWDAAPTIQHQCGGCGAVWDQDANHVKNLLANDDPEGEAGNDVPPVEHVEPASGTGNT
jgi:hypothetical protein